MRGRGGTRCLHNAEVFAIGVAARPSGKGDRRGGLLRDGGGCGPLRLQRGDPGWHRGGCGWGVRGDRGPERGGPCLWQGGGRQRGQRGRACRDPCRDGIWQGRCRRHRNGLCRGRLARHEGRLGCSPAHFCRAGRRGGGGHRRSVDRRNDRVWCGRHGHCPRPAGTQEDEGGGVGPVQGGRWWGWLPVRRGGRGEWGEWVHRPVRGKVRRGVGRPVPLAHDVGRDGVAQMTRPIVVGDLGGLRVICNFRHVGHDFWRLHPRFARCCIGALRAGLHRVPLICRGPEGKRRGIKLPCRAISRMRCRFGRGVGGGVCLSAILIGRDCAVRDLGCWRSGFRPVKHSPAENGPFEDGPFENG